jgi:hypothetical protein
MSKHVESHVQVGLELLWQVKLALLLETCACVALTQGLEGRPVSCELLRDTALGRDDGLRGLLATVLAPCAPGRGVTSLLQAKYSLKSATVQHFLHLRKYLIKSNLVS